MLKNKFWIVLFLVIIVGAGIWIIKNQQPNKNKCEKCNVMVLDVDILRADELPCYGYFRNTAPNICALAKKSVMFMDNYSTSYWTFPSIMSTFTSMYPTFHRMQNIFADKLSPDITTLAETLKKQGYNTVFVSEGGYALQQLTQENGGLRGYNLVTTEPVEKVIDSLSKRSEPWFVYYHTSALHIPYLLPEGAKPIDESLVKPVNLPITETDFNKLLNKYLKQNYSKIFKEETVEKYKSIILGPEKADDTSVAELFNSLKWDNYTASTYLLDVGKPVIDTYMASFDQGNKSETDYLRMLYDTNIKLMDDKLKNLFLKINSRPLSKNTITVITSDHGEAFGEHEIFSHNADYHKEIFYIPLIFHGPKLSAKQINGVSSLVDIFPTILDLTGIEIPKGLQGQSLLPEIEGQINNSRKFVISEYWGNVILQNKDWLYYLPSDITDPTKSVLYNRKTDPGEKNNTITSNPELGELLYGQAEAFRSYNLYYENKTEFSSDILKNIDPEKLERLRKEGYF